MNTHVKTTVEDSSAYYTRDARVLTLRGRLFRLLSDGGWHGADELAHVGGIGFHASLRQFRLAGWRIESKRLGRHWRYRMAAQEQNGGGHQ
jgi:hypothetical protein